MLYTLLFVGDLFFWLVALILFGIVTACIENEKGFGATVTLLLSIVAFTLFTDFNIFSWLSQLDIWYLASFIVGYFIAGTGWCIFKWYLFLIDRKEEAEEFKKNYLKRKNLSKLDNESEKDFVEELKYSNSYGSKSFPPQVSKHKDDIILWACYWPFSLIWTVLGDFLIRIWNRIYTVIKNFLQNMSNNIFKDV